MLYPQSEIDRIKREVSVEQFLDNPKRQGGFLVARCHLPGHDDKTPSFRYNLAEGWWKCMGCGRVARLEPAESGHVRRAARAGPHPAPDPARRSWPRRA